MQEQRQAKQKYLCENVLQQGFDAQDFAEYCEKICGNVDIDNWSFKDLEHIVIGYIKSKTNILQGQDNPAETSFADYQQQQKIESQRPPSPAVKNRPPSPIKQVFREPNRGSKKQIFKVSTFDNPPSPPVRHSVQNKVKLAPSQKSNLDELFKDPFKKKVNNQPSEWDSNIWSKATQKKPTSDFNKFDFDQILSKPTQPVYPKSQPKRAEKKQSVAQPPVSKTSQTKKQKQKQKPIGNTKIFDIDFNDIVDIQTLKKSHQSPRQTPIQHKVQASHTTQPYKIDWSSPKPSTAQVVSTITNSKQVHLYASGNPQTRRKNKQQGIKVVQQDWYDIVKCIKAKTRQLALKPNLQIIITGHEVVNKNVFVPDYVRYFVSTPAINSQVKRKYNHFTKLRANLEKFYPGFKLPYLAKGSWFQESDPNNISIQKAMITHFMNDVLMNRQLRNCRIVEQFLTLNDYKGLKIKFQEYQKMAILHSIQQLCLLQGEISVGYSQAHRIYIDKLPSYLQSMQGIFDKYKKLLDQLVHNHLSLQRTLNDLAETTKAMQNLTKNFNTSVQIGECNELEGTLKLINKLYKQLDKQSKFDMDLVESQLKPLFKYEKQNIGTIRDLISQKNKFQQIFNPNNKNQKLDKKQVYTTQSLNQYKVKINEPSKSLTVLNYQHGYYSNQIVLEAKRMFGNLSTKLSNKFGQYCQDCYERTQQYSKFWNDIKGVISLPLVQ